MTDRAVQPDAHTARRVAGVLSVVAALNIAGWVLVPAYRVQRDAIAAGPQTLSDVISPLALHLVETSPLVMLACAFVALARFGFDTGSGGAAGVRAARHIREASEWALSAAAAAFVFAPTIAAWISGDRGLAFNITDVGVFALLAGVVGAAVAQLMRRHAEAALEHELIV